MHYQKLARRTDFFKHKPKGVNAVCEIIQELMKEGHTEGLDEARTHTALEMLRDKEPMDKIIRYSQLSQERIEALAQQLH